MNKEGPTVMMDQYRSCLGCKYHDQQMERSGLNPVYVHFCGHPDAPKSISSYIVGKTWIGHSDRTPDWCPVMTPRSSPATGGPPP